MDTVTEPGATAGASRSVLTKYPEGRSTRA